MIRFVLCLLACALAAPAGATEAGWALLRNGGQVVLLRHAAAPGTGDPANFDITKCSTQRNLSDRGRQQAETDHVIAAGGGKPDGGDGIGPVAGVGSFSFMMPSRRATSE